MNGPAVVTGLHFHMGLQMAGLSQAGCFPELAVHMNKLSNLFRLVGQGIAMQNRCSSLEKCECLGRILRSAGPRHRSS